MRIGVADPFNNKPWPSNGRLGNHLGRDITWCCYVFFKRCLVGDGWSGSFFFVIRFWHGSFGQCKARQILVVTKLIDLRDVRKLWLFIQLELESEWASLPTYFHWRQRLTEFEELGDVAATRSMFLFQQNHRFYFLVLLVVYVAADGAVPSSSSSSTLKLSVSLRLLLLQLLQLLLLQSLL